MSNCFKTVQKYAEAQIIEKKSKFIAHVKPLSDEHQAVEFIQEIRARHYDATHNVYAYCVEDGNGGTDQTGAIKNTGIIQRYSDDGEPSGTAGIPVLDVIKGGELKNVAVVVTRYFGGTLLGTGGLVRAYGKCAKEGIEAAGIAVMTLYDLLEIEISYNYLGKIKHVIEIAGHDINDIRYVDKVYVLVHVEISKTLDFIKSVTDVTNANANIKKIKQQYMPQ